MESLEPDRLDAVDGNQKKKIKFMVLSEELVHEIRTCDCIIARC